MKEQLATNVSVDIGNNLTQLLEKLAVQIGTTADKIFPWYVQQQILEGWIFIGLLSIFITIALITLYVGLSRGHWDQYGSPDKMAIIGVLGILLTVVCMTVGAGGLPDAITKITNPQYHALHDIFHDLSKSTQK